jgi:hypothetical protein
VPRLCEVSSGICLTTEEKARKNFLWSTTGLKMWDTNRRRVRNKKLPDIGDFVFPSGAIAHTACAWKPATYTTQCGTILKPSFRMARFSAPVETGPGAHPAPYIMGSGSFQGVRGPGRGVDHPPPSSADVKERVELYLFSPSGPSRAVLGWNLPLLLPSLPIMKNKCKSLVHSSQIPERALFFVKFPMLGPFVPLVRVTCR